MPFDLTPAEARVLGSLMEKEIATPEYYPLSLNALVNACNQRSSRHPVMDLDEEAVREALAGLEARGLAGGARGAEARVPKYEHRLQERLNLRRPETALLCVLLLRGAQTPGELRGRVERLHAFAALDEVQAVLQRMAERESPLVRLLPREPGAREARYLETLSAGREAGMSGPSAPPVLAHPGAAGAAAPEGESREPLARLEAEVRELRERLEALERQLGISS